MRWFGIVDAIEEHVVGLNHATNPQASLAIRRRVGRQATPRLRQFAAREERPIWVADREIPGIPEKPGVQEEEAEDEPEDEPEEEPNEEDEDKNGEPVDLAASFASIVNRKALEAGLYHA